jgi:DnaK suppressor protein
VTEERARELLARERARVESLLAGLQQHDDSELTVVDQHQADVGTETFEQERDAGLADDLRERLRDIERAEHRLENGTYGVSTLTGEPIPDARLELMPWAELTAEEQARVERTP